MNLPEGKTALCVSGDVQVLGAAQRSPDCVLGAKGELCGKRGQIHVESCASSEKQSCYGAGRWELSNGEQLMEDGFDTT